MTFHAMLHLFIMMSTVIGIIGGFQLTEFVDPEEHAVKFALDKETGQIYTCSRRALCHLDPYLNKLECTERSFPCQILLVDGGQRYLFAGGDMSYIYSLRSLDDVMAVYHGGAGSFPPCPGGEQCYLMTARASTGTRTHYNLAVSMLADHPRAAHEPFLSQRKLELTRQGQPFMDYEINGGIVSNHVLRNDIEVEAEAESYDTMLLVKKSLLDQIDLVFISTFSDRNSFQYLLLNQRLTGGGYQAYLARVCGGFSTLTSYSQIPLGEGQMARASYYDEKYDLIFVVFVTDDRPEESVIGTFNMYRLRERFTNLATGCNFKGKGSLLPWLVREHNRTTCEKVKRPPGLSQGEAICEITSGNTGMVLEDITALSQNGMWRVEGHDVTSILVTRYPTNVMNQRVVVMGTSKGVLLKVLLQLEMHKPDLLSQLNLWDTKEGSPVSQLTFDTSQQNIYVVTGHKVVLFPAESCSIYTDCGQCVTSVDPLGCGWRLDLCMRRPNSHDEIWKKDTCSPVLQQISPLSGPAQGGTLLTLSGHTFGLEMTSTYRGLKSEAEVRIGNTVCPIVSRDNNRVVCRTAAASAGFQLDVSLTVKDDTQLAVPADIVGRTYTQDKGFRYKDVSLASRTDSVALSPKHGPISGGTLLTIFGSSLDAGGQAGVIVDGSECQIQERTDDQIVCRTPALQLDYSAHFPSIEPDLSRAVVSVSIDDAALVASERFIYRSDPAVHQFHPRVTFASGGIPIRVEGRHLDNVQQARMMVRVVGGDETANVTCMSQVGSGGSRMICSSPALSLPGSAAALSSLLTNIWFTMDAAEAPRQFPVTHTSMATLTYFSDPVFPGFTSVRTLYTNETAFFIQGEALSSLSYIEDVTVTLGSLDCMVVEIRISEIVCRPGPPGTLRFQADHLPVKVEVGYLKFDLGFVRIRDPGLECTCACGCD